MIRKILKIFLIVILLLFVVIICGSFFLLGTDTGFRWTAERLESAIPGLSMSPTSGNLEEGIAAERVSWSNDSLDVAIDGFDSKWSSDCLLRSTYCLDRLALEKVSVKSRPKPASAPSKPGPIELPSIKLPIEIDAKEITIKSLELDLKENSEPIVLENLRLEAKTNGTVLDLEQLRGQWEEYSVQLNGSIDLSSDYPLDVQIGMIHPALIDNQALSAKLFLSNSVKDLIVRGHTRGAVVTHIEGTVHPLDPALPINLAIDWEENGWPVTTHDMVKSSDAALAIDGTLQDYAIHFKSKFSGTQFPDVDLDIQGTVNTERALIPQIDLLTLDGYAVGSAAVDWTQGVTWIAELIAKEINPGIQWPEMSGNLNAITSASGVAADGKWTLAVDRASITGELREFPFQLDARVNKSSDDLWSIDTLTLENGPNNLQLSGSYGDELDVDSKIDFPAIHFLLPTVAGNLKADAKVSGDIAEPSIALTASSSLIKLGSILLRGLNLDASVQRAGLDASQVKLSINRFNANVQEFSSVRLDVDGNREKHQVAAAASGPEQTSVNLRSSGSLTDSFDWNGILESSSIGLPSHSLKLRNKPTLSWSQSDAEFAIDPHCWLVNDSSLCLRERVVAADYGQARVTWDNYQLKALTNFLPATTKVDGALTAQADVSWGDAESATESGEQKRNPNGPFPFSLQLNANIDNAGLEVADEGKTTHTFKVSSIELQSNADPYSIVSTLALDSDDLGTANVGLTLNPLNPEQDIAGELSLKDFNIGFLKAFLPQLDTIDGNINIDGKVSGRLSDPQFDGTLYLFDPKVSSVDLPLSIDGGAIEASITGQRATLDGKLQSGDGTIGLGGNISWINRTPRARINVEGKSLVIEQAPITYSVVNPTLRIDYSPEQLAISGKVSVPSADINIKALPEGTTALSSDVIIIEEEAEQQLKEEKAPPFDINVKVDVSLGNDVNLAGYGLEAKLEGDISVSKRGEDPVQLGGEIIVTEGFYKSYGQDLSVTDGRILFVGPIERTTLNIDAIREIENEERIAGLHLEGNIADPQVTLFTEPADKTQESILSYLVLGRDLGGGVDSSEEQLLAAAALALTLREGKGFATGFAESLGISDFSMTAAGSGDDTQVVLSGRLSSRLLLRYGRSVFDAEDTLFLRYDISKKLYLEAARGVERAVDLFYSFSF